MKRIGLVLILSIPGPSRDLAAPPPTRDSQDGRAPVVTVPRGRGTTALWSRSSSWAGYAGDAQHTAQSRIESKPIRRAHWQTPVDLKPQYSATGELFIHYGSPLVTGGNTVIVPVKTGETGGFRVEARAGADGTLMWSLATDYVLPSQRHSWTPVFGPALTAASLYVPGAGGTLIVRDQPDSSAGEQARVAFYGLANYEADPSAYDAKVMIDTPLTSDPAGNVYFGFFVGGSTPLGLTSGIARLTPSGSGSWVSVAAAAADASMTQVTLNCAPALSPDRRTLYVAVSDGSAGYLVALDSTTLSPLARVRLVDPMTGVDSWLHPDGSASPTVGPDGDVYFGVLETPFPENNGRGWLLHFDGSLAESRTPGAFGWDDTASVVPASAVPSYRGSSAYLLMSKYNNYFESGGDGRNRIAVLDPFGGEADPVTGVTVMSEILTIAGPTRDGSFPRVKEWCINSAAVDPASGSVLANSEDGRLYRWDLSSNTLSETVVLTPGLGEAYTPTVIGVDGTVYAINNATLFAVGR
jgi:hypothetical protein